MKGLGNTIYNLSSEAQRLITSPPTNEEQSCNVPNVNTIPVVPPTPSLEGIEQLHDKNIYVTDDIAMNFDEEDKTLHMSDYYFSKPELMEAGSNASCEELEDSIEKCKTLILNCDGASERRRTLVHRLIQLRYSLERAKEENEVKSLGIQVIKGHQLSPLMSPIRDSPKQFCDKCCKVIWSVIHVLYKCTFCEYKCHGRCVKSNHRKCPKLKLEENPNLVMTICPEKGLSAQNFRCAECHSLITNKNVWGESRLCDYSGKYYCPLCHWNSRVSIPARIIHNWDFEEHFVCQGAKQLLSFAERKPIFNLEELNPNLFKFVDELCVIKKLRKDLILMKVYLFRCKKAQEEHLLRKLEVRQHFVESADSYSLKDLYDINNGETLIEFLKNIHQIYSVHIKSDCEACKGKGFICELCSSEEIIFPFDSGVSVCETCSATFHLKCHTKECPRCIRLSNRKMSLSPS